ncbi:hypothetical protein BGZ61DRAFT_526422 [Ilyonectria robusta]|uniref:uncharacterized protein n=1 Tax=Ilyonectria robusta TaxID=1079257 RepID=UPI001E8E7EC8|nr:uncharacterized protein BGZ61DRAFT_526422 [Ilyonectria robusta]KAH8738448.1 hypothetical protein BGZ61DRAFT_526422 [Ilyonectria robusta]
MALMVPNTTEIDDALRLLCHEDNAQEAQYRAFCQFYGKVTSCSPNPEHHVISMGTPAFRSHSEILSLVSKLRLHSDKSQTDLIHEMFAGADREEAEQALRVIVKIAYMFDCASVKTFSQQFKIESDGSFPVEWRREQTLVELVQSAFPYSADSKYTASRKDRALKVWKLRKRYGIHIVPTDDLVQHLYYDRQTKCLSVFHQVAWLKAQLRHASGNDLLEPMDTSLKNGTLPPQLLLETLYSIYHILLPLDKKSAKLAKKLVLNPKKKTRGFDPDILIYDGLIRPVPEPFQLMYWKKRLDILREIVDNPPPSNSFTSWFERHTSERNALTVAIIGVFLAALFGFLSFIVGIAQLVVSILAWKNPAQA